ncbi:alpha/beta hydrolase family protein [Nonlabens dokdonensis]|uniref:Alpha/beta superfamily hydrolase n=2 Tax=Nonlabens dokdonensis TaxID=328515 RepID=L7W9B7_NONDD|nr:alpha/beta fold hydrolase [Nonlabens dokdonensis]AGC76426.1 alpha/beta superfamily hydrolase [Nonlabens dokdonensis DSW-6]PZX44084.1 alpha/beta hydrolase family protein [Nonlabens dokdonensis]
MITSNNNVLKGENNRAILLDYQYLESDQQLPVVVFCHGYKGFKDWGAWSLMGSAFAKAGFLFIKFNYSHNGGTVEEPIDFPDLDAFSKNNYSMEVRETKLVLDWIESSQLPIDKTKINLIGHSRAGGITTIVTANDSRVSKLITLAGVADYAERFPSGKALEEWKEKGVMHVKNGRTGQDMPHLYQFFEDFKNNEEDLTILKQAQKITQPHLILHGDNDEAVHVNDAHKLHKASPNSQLKLIRDANHVLGASHPWHQDRLPEDLRQAVQCMINFLRY